VDPVFPEQALDQLEKQVEELSPAGLKLYPNSYTAGGVVGCSPVLLVSVR
jgi:hypothetical protein